ncbi:MAG: DUF366 family protein [Thermaerobacter sp.]|nr:DUF366 family protein [Thermaerobacter sp.]
MIGWRHLERPLPYDGSQLSAQWALRHLGLLGDSMVSFVGPCRVLGTSLVDLEDAQAGREIRSASMLHFLVEHFDRDLERAVLRQRLLLALVRDVLEELRPGLGLVRRGDDLYQRERKLSVSVATVSPVSTLIHAGLNVDPTGAPVAAVGLAEWGLEPAPVAAAVARAYIAELEGIARARCKVRGVN